MFRKNSGIEKFQAKEGKLHGSVEIFLSHRTEKTSPGNHSVFQKISGTENYFMDKRGGGITIFRRSFCLTVPRYFIGEHFGVSEKFFYRKFSCIGGGGASRVCRFFSVSQDQNEKLSKGTLPFSESFLVSKTFMDKKGLIAIFNRNFYVSQCRKLLQRNPTVFEKILGFYG